MQPPPKITADRGVTNECVRRWTAFRTPPALLLSICGGLGPEQDLGTRRREILGAMVLKARHTMGSMSYGEAVSKVVKYLIQVNHLVHDKKDAQGFDLLMEKAPHLLEPFQNPVRP